MKSTMECQSCGEIFEASKNFDCPECKSEDTLEIREIKSHDESMGIGGDGYSESMYGE